MKFNEFDELTTGRVWAKAEGLIRSYFRNNTIYDDNWTVETKKDEPKKVIRFGKIDDLVSIARKSVQKHLSGKDRNKNFSDEKAFEKYLISSFHWNAENTVEGNLAREETGFRVEKFNIIKDSVRDWVALRDMLDKYNVNKSKQLEWTRKHLLYSKLDEDLESAANVK